MESNTNARWQSVLPSPRRHTKQAALKIDWQRRWNGQSRDKRKDLPKKSRRRRHKPSLPPGAVNENLDCTQSPAMTSERTIPCSLSRNSFRGISDNNSHALSSPMSYASFSASSSNTSRDISSQDTQVPLPGHAPTERHSKYEPHLDFDNENEIQTKAFHSPDLLNTQGPLERFLAQNEFHWRSQKRAIADFLRLRSLRAEALRLRSTLRAKRQLLREKQAAKFEADEAFIRYVREHLFPSNRSADITGSNVLHELFEVMQESRNIYGPLQEDYDKLEETLDDTEFELGILEGRIHNKPVPEFSKAPGEHYQNQPTSQRSSSFSSSSSDERSEKGENCHPIHAQLLSRLGDLDIATESLHGMRQEYEEILANEEPRMKVGISLPKSLKSRLAELPQQQLLLEEEITGIKEDVEKLYSDCLTAGILVDKNGARHRPPVPMKHDMRDTEESFTATDDVDILEGITTPFNTSTHNIKRTFPFLLPRTEDEEDYVQSLTPKFDQSNKRGLINHWLLVDLQASRLQVDLLHRISDDIFVQWKLELNIQKWQLDVLKFWAKDDANKFPRRQDTCALSSTAQSRQPTTLRGKIYAKSIDQSPTHSCAPPMLHFRKSAPELLEREHSNQKRPA